MIQPHFTPEDIKQFWSHVDMTSECWVWRGAIHREGYGRTRVAGRQENAHRVAYMLAYGAIPDGLCVCHHCDNRPCCRPAHLFVGTRADNNTDRAKKGRSSRGASHWTHKYPEKVYKLNISAEQINEIRDLHDNKGVTCARIGRRFGFSREFVDAIVNHRGRFRD